MHAHNGSDRRQMVWVAAAAAAAHTDGLSERLLRQVLRVTADVTSSRRRRQHEKEEKTLPFTHHRSPDDRVCAELAALFIARFSLL